MGPRLDPSRAKFVAWRRRLWRWGLKAPQNPRIERRLWRVTVDPGRRKIRRTLPSGRLIRIFEEGKAALFADLRSGRVDGPVYHLTYEDAAALWRDRYVRIVPACDQLVVSAEGEV